VYGFPASALFPVDAAVIPPHIFDKLHEDLRLSA
jgi:hypothetical protein